MNRRFVILLAGVLAGCSGEKSDPEPTAVSKAPPASEPTEPTAKEEPKPAPAPPSSGPRYVRRVGGALVDASYSPSVPAFMVEQDIKGLASRSGAAAVLRRFGVNAPAGKSGQLWMAKASLVDDANRERLIFASFRSDAAEEVVLVFLGTTTKDDRVFGLGTARVSAKASVDITARRLHSPYLDDVVVTFSKCGTPQEKGCHVLRAWTMQRGLPELVADVSADDTPRLVGSAPPYEIATGDRTLRFDREAFAYKELP